MTLLSIAQDVNAEIKTGSEITFLVNNSDPDARLILRLAQKVGISLMQKVDWQALTGEVVAPSVADELQAGLLPGDFDRFQDETFWNRSTDSLVIGPVNGVTWQGLKAGQPTVSNREPRFRYRGGDILIFPAPGAGEELAFEYISRNFCESAGGTPQPRWLADDDVGILDEELITLGVIFGYYLSEGLPQTAAAGETFMERLDQLVRNDQSDTRIMAAADIFEGPRHTIGSPKSRNYDGVLGW